MLFNSYVFVFAFLPAVLSLWYAAEAFGQPRLGQTILVGMSLVFYGYGHPEYILLILVSILGNYTVSALIARVDGKKRQASRLRMTFGIAGILFNAGLLFYFKYYDFFVWNVDRFMDTGLAVRNIALPLGISFFTFQQISFIVDRMWGRAEHYGILDYLNYVTFFPQLVAGPIVNHGDLAPQFGAIGSGRRRLLADKEAAIESFENGICLFIAGLAKKVLLADTLGAVVDFGYGNVGGLDAVSALVVMLAYTFQIYFDFSGYCDMAVGLGWMMQIRLPQNFNSPYKSTSVREFWNRWHMTLNAFFAQYIYIPLGGSRCGTAKMLRNTMLVFLVSGIWHGAAWSFVLWGAAHGVVVCAERLWEKRLSGTRPGQWWLTHVPKRMRMWGGWLYTFLFVNLAWVLFRSGSISVAIQLYRRLFSFSSEGKIWKLAALMERSWNYQMRVWIELSAGEAFVPLFLLCVLVAFLVVAAALCAGKNARQWIVEKEGAVGRMWGLAFLFALCVLSFSGVTTFLYFNF